MRPLVLTTQVLAFAAVIAFAVYLFLQPTGRHESPYFAWLVVGVFVLLALNTLTWFVRVRRIAAESRAGYTTVRTKTPGLPQLDPKTGDLVRPALNP